MDSRWRIDVIDFEIFRKFDGGLVQSVYLLDDREGYFMAGIG